MRLELVSERPHLPPPPGREVLGRHVDSKVSQGLGAEVAVEWPLHTGVGVVPLGVGLDSADIEAHDLPEQFAYLVLGELVLARKLQHSR